VKEQSKPALDPQEMGGHGLKAPRDNSWKKFPLELLSWSREKAVSEPVSRNWKQGCFDGQ